MFLLLLLIASKQVPGASANIQIDKFKNFAVPNIRKVRHKKHNYLLLVLGHVYANNVWVVPLESQIDVHSTPAHGGIIKIKLQ